MKEHEMHFSNIIKNKIIIFFRNPENNWKIIDHRKRNETEHIKIIDRGKEKFAKMERIIIIINKYIRNVYKDKSNYWKQLELILEKGYHENKVGTRFYSWVQTWWSYKRVDSAFPLCLVSRYWSGRNTFLITTIYFSNFGKKKFQTRSTIHIPWTCLYFFF